MVNALLPDIRNNVSFRLYEKGIYNLKDILSSEIQNFKFNDRRKDELADGLLNEARLYIGDSNSTSWLESLVINIPTLLFLSEEFLDNHQSISEINEAFENNMIFTSSSDLSIWLNKNYKVINDWWETKKIQKIRKSLVRKYCNSVDIKSNIIKYSAIINL